MLLLYDGKSPDSPLSHCRIPAVRGKVASFLPDGHKSLFSYSACSNTTWVGRRQRLTIAGPGLKSRLLPHLAFAGRGGDGATVLLLPMMFGYSEVASV